MSPKNRWVIRKGKTKRQVLTAYIKVINVDLTNSDNCGFVSEGFIAEIELMITLVILHQTGERKGDVGD